MWARNQHPLTQKGRFQPASAVLSGSDVLFSIREQKRVLEPFPGPGGVSVRTRLRVTETSTGTARQGDGTSLDRRVGPSPGAGWLSQLKRLDTEEANDLGMRRFSTVDFHARAGN